MNKENRNFLNEGSVCLSMVEWHNIKLFIKSTTSTDSAMRELLADVDRRNGQGEK